MRRKNEYNPEEEEPVTFVKIKPGARERAQQKPIHKSSYEGNADVQRWLKLQAVDEQNAKPTFQPTFLASQRDASWLLSSLARFYDENLISDVLYAVRSGKEATVYCCRAHPSTGVEYLAAKVYRPRMFRNLRNDAVYRLSRVQRDEQGKALHGGTRHGTMTRKGEKGRSSQVASWIEYEYQTQCLLYESGCDVPRPYGHLGNAVLMEYLGDGEEGAPLLSEVQLQREEAQPLFEQILRNIELALAHHRIHGDLSEYNILYWQEQVKLIDFAQAVDPVHNSDVFTLFARDVERVCHYFARYGVVADADALAKRLWLRSIGATHPM
ncbi:MAG TPA: RIO1 family regulatory kinase/ATPase [Ktedonobacteraceae bacterium]|nr:RIO1 family regulatory kinase/ATPase [Ktedonobacteraceae bacterium]